MVFNRKGREGRKGIGSSGDRAIRSIGLSISSGIAAGARHSDLGGVCGLAAAIGFVAPVIFRVFFPDCDSPACGFILLPIIALPTLIGGVFGFPLCGIWLDQRRQRRKAAGMPIPLM
jgi:hypothetical protein